MSCSKLQPEGLPLRFLGKTHEYTYFKYLQICHMAVTQETVAFLLQLCGGVLMSLSTNKVPVSTRRNERSFWWGSQESGEWIRKGRRRRRKVDKSLTTQRWSILFCSYSLASPHASFKLAPLCSLEVALEKPHPGLGSHHKPPPLTITVSIPLVFVFLKPLT